MKKIIKTLKARKNWREGLTIPEIVKEEECRTIRKYYVLTLMCAAASVIVSIISILLKFKVL